jgi:uncharacterized membrane protein
MMLLLAGLVLFIGVHSLRLVADDWRQHFIASYGANTWKLLYSVLSIAGLVLFVYGYGQSRAEPVFLWNPSPWTRYAALLFTLIAFILFAAAQVPANLIKQKLGHPLYGGVKIWAFAHLLANGRLGDVLLFGTLLVWAIIGFALSRRRDRKLGLAYPAGTLRNTFFTVLAGSVAWAVFAFWLHRLLIGVPPL